MGAEALRSRSPRLRRVSASGEIRRSSDTSLRGSAQTPLAFIHGRPVVCRCRRSSGSRNALQGTEYDHSGRRRARSANKKGELERKTIKFSVNVFMSTALTPTRPCKAALCQDRVGRRRSSRNPAYPAGGFARPRRSGGGSNSSTSCTFPEFLWIHAGDSGYSVHPSSSRGWMPIPGCFC